MYWWPFEPKQWTISRLSHLDNERQLNINNVWSCILCNQAIARILYLITELLTASVIENTNHERKSIDSKKIGIATCKNSKCNYWMLNKRFWSNTILTQQYQEHYINLQLDLLDNPLTARRVQTSSEISIQHQHNVNPSWSHTQSSQTLQATSPVLLSTSGCSQTPLELIKVLSDSARAFSGAPESTCSYRGAFRMRPDLTYRIVELWSSWDLCADLRESWCRILTAVVLIYAQGIGSYDIHLCYSHKIRHITIGYTLFKSLCIYTYGQSGCRWSLSIIGGAPRHENLEMHHLEAIVVRGWS